MPQLRPLLALAGAEDLPYLEASFDGALKEGAVQLATVVSGLFVCVQDLFIVLTIHRPDLMALFRLKLQVVFPENRIIEYNAFRAVLGVAGKARSYQQGGECPG